MSVETIELPDTRMGRRCQDDLRMIANITSFELQWSRDDAFEVMYAVHQSRLRQQAPLEDAWDRGECAGGLS